MSLRPEASFHVYVVELDLPRSLYVGSTAHAPSSRMLRHLQGRKASRYVREHGVRLRPDLTMGRAGPYATRSEARRWERKLAYELEMRGYTVYGACTDCRL